MAGLTLAQDGRAGGGGDAGREVEDGEGLGVAGLTLAHVGGEGGVENGGEVGMEAQGSGDGARPEEGGAVEDGGDTTPITLTPMRRTFFSCRCSPSHFCPFRSIG